MYVSGLTVAGEQAKNVSYFYRKGRKHFQVWCQTRYIYVYDANICIYKYVYNLVIDGLNSMQLLWLP